MELFTLTLPWLGEVVTATLDGTKLPSISLSFTSTFTGTAVFSDVVP